MLGLGWKPKINTLYSSHDSIHRRVVGQKVYITTGSINRSVKLIIRNKTYAGSFMISNGLCNIKLKSDREHRFLTPEKNVRFRKEINKTQGKGQNQYGTPFTYPQTYVVYIAEVIDSAKMKQLDGLSNKDMARLLFKSGIIKSKEPEFIYRNPAKPESVNLSKIEGMLLGIAIGDSLGNTSEGMEPRHRENEYGLITDYLPNKHEYGKKIGLPSDDTQLAFDTLDVILDKGRLDMEELARVFSSHEIFGIGKIVRGFLRNYKVRREPWYVSGVVGGAENGALMRIAPVIIPFLGGTKESLYSDTVLATIMTHNSALAIGSSVAFIDLLRKFITLNSPPKDMAYIKEFTECLDAFTSDTKYEIRSKKVKSDSPRTAYGFISKALEYGSKKNMSTEEFSNYFGSGAYVLETDTILLYILSRYIGKPQEAIIQAVNYTRDNDTVASVVGAAMGALYGTAAFKNSWIEGLSGRIRKHDDGKIFDMIKQTKRFLSGANADVQIEEKDKRR
ncbi:MAG: ADP-ribosylglycohydrolase family protein [Candidatus Micrarchaeaceae archaeon]